MNIEATIIQYLAGVLNVPVSADVPTNRPASFVTVERTGGDLTSVSLDSADVSIQAWAKTRFEASTLMEQIDTAMQDITNVENITKVSRDSIHNWPDPDYSMARYQGFYDLIFYKEE